MNPIEYLKKNKTGAIVGVVLNLILMYFHPTQFIVIITSKMGIIRLIVSAFVGAFVESQIKQAR